MIRQPSSVIIAGPSGSGKTDLVEQWLRYLNVFQVKPKKIVYAYDRWQPRIDRMQKQGDIQFHRGLPDLLHLTQWFGRTLGGVLVLDDLMEEGGQDKRVLDLFTKDSHHRNITVLYLRKIYSPLVNFPRPSIAMPITSWRSKTPEIKRVYEPFYCKPSPTDGVKSCANLNASRPAPLAI